jgi:hypothetical protein
MPHQRRKRVLVLVVLVQRVDGTARLMKCSSAACADSSAHPHSGTTVNIEVCCRHNTLLAASQHGISNTIAAARRTR